MGGMCCAMTTGKGKFAGKEGKSLASASGPPVETPMATILSWARTNRSGVESNLGARSRGSGTVRRRPLYAERARESGITL